MDETTSNRIDQFQTLTEDTLRLIAGQEGRDVDFKLSHTGVSSEDFVAFANGHGGTILLGVAEDSTENGQQRGKVEGCDISDKVRQGLISMAASCRPTIQVRLSVENLATNKPILRIDIPEGQEKPYCTASGKYKLRGDGQNLPIDPSMMRTLIFEQESEKFLGRFRAAGDEIVQMLKEISGELKEGPKGE